MHGKEEAVDKKYFSIEPRDQKWILTIKRPEVLNALNFELLTHLKEAFLDFKQDPEARILIITGQGEKAFCAGADLSSPIGCRNCMTLVLDRVRPRVDHAGTGLRCRSIPSLRSVRRRREVITRSRHYSSNIRSQTLFPFMASRLSVPLPGISVQLCSDQHNTGDHTHNTASF